MRSTDGAKTWQAASSGAPFGQVTAILGDPSNPNNAVASVILESPDGPWIESARIIRSTNGGASWQSVDTINGFAERLSQCSANPSVMYASTRLGVRKSIDLGISWNW